MGYNVGRPELSGVKTTKQEREKNEKQDNDHDLPVGCKTPPSGGSLCNIPPLGEHRPQEWGVYSI